MASPESVVGKVCGWGGLLAALLAPLQILGVPFVHELGSPLVALLSSLGCAVSAATPPIVLKKKK